MYMCGYMCTYVYMCVLMCVLRCVDMCESMCFMCVGCVDMCESMCFMCVGCVDVCECRSLVYGAAGSLFIRTSTLIIQHAVMYSRPCAHRAHRVLPPSRSGQVCTRRSARLLFVTHSLFTITNSTTTSLQSTAT